MLEEFIGLGWEESLGRLRIAVPAYYMGDAKHVIYLVVTFTYTGS